MSMINYRLSFISLNDAQKQFDTLVSKMSGYWQSIPGSTRMLISLCVAIELFFVLVSLLRSIIYNRNNWAKRPGQNLMYSFFYYSGQHQRRAIYRDAFSFLLDRKNPNWSNYSIARIAYLIGNMESESAFSMIAISLAYIPLAALGMLEEIVRFLIAIIPYTLLNICYFIVLLLAKFVNLLFVPVFSLIDRHSSISQYCPSCYGIIKTPIFECSNSDCKKMHDNLFPGVSGLLWARCFCGTFLPCNAVSSRKRLQAYCPQCKTALPSGNISTLDIQVIGSNESGKSSFIQAFNDCYNRGKNSYRYRECVPVQPSESEVTEVCPHYFFNTDRRISDEGVVMREIADEYIMSGDYKQSPIYYSFCDGISIIINPLEDVNSFESSEKIIANFIDQYSRYTARRANKRSNIPVAVVIVKADLPDILKEIGPDKILKEYKSNRGKYKSIEEARNEVCRAFLASINMENALLNLETVFSKVAYFPASSIHYGETGDAFMPKHILDPILWIAESRGSSIRSRIMDALEDRV